MARSKESKPEEFFLGQIRELKAENKALRRRIRQLEKREHQYEETDEEIPNLPVGEQNNKQLYCASCGKGKLEILEVLGRVFSTCSICGDRKKLK